MEEEAKQIEKPMPAVLPLRGKLLDVSVVCLFSDTMQKLHQSQT